MNASTDCIHQTFIAGSQLQARWQGQGSFAILASDFGDGSIFLWTWHAWQQDTQRNQRLHYLAFANPTAPAIQAAPPQLQPLLDELLAQWPLAIDGFHRIYLQGGQVMLTLIFGSVRTMLSEVSGPIDAFFLTHEESNAHLDLAQFKQIWRLCKAESTLLSRIATPAIAQHLHAAGFTATIFPQYLLAHCLRAPKSTSTPCRTRHAIIIGAGMAGCAAAASLASRGWHIHLIDAQPTIASQASGNHIGLCHPVFSLDDNFQARLSRAGFFVTQQKLAALQGTQQGVAFAKDGHLQIAKDAAAAQLMQTILAVQELPSSLVTWFGAIECSQNLNIESEFGGWWFPQGMWVNPISLCNGYINASNENISLQLNTHINLIKRVENTWHLYDADAQLIATTETLILANANDAQRLLPELSSHLSASLRSVTKLPTSQLHTSPYSFSGLTYLTAAFDGWRCAGASLVSEDSGSAEQNNLNDLAKLIGYAAIESSDLAETRLCFRPNSADRLPLVGQLADTSDIRHSVHQLFHIPRMGGLYALLGFGSRGLTWHALAAEVLACQLNAEPQGIERSLLGAIDPARFVLRQLRKKTAASQNAL